jgi:hypothetical protein
MNWRGICLGALFSASIALPVKADFITGDLAITGGNTLNVAAHQFKFVAGTAIDVSGTGDLSPFVLFTPVTMRNVGTALTYTGLGLVSGSNLTCGTGGIIGGCFFQTTVGALTAGFDLDTYTFAETVLPLNTVTIFGKGFMYLTGFDPTPADFIFTTQDLSGGKRVTSFSATVAVPGPIVGAGLPSLILACGGLAALARRRRRRFAAA